MFNTVLILLNFFVCFLSFFICQLLDDKKFFKSITECNHVDWLLRKFFQLKFPFEFVLFYAQIDVWQVLTIKARLILQKMQPYNFFVCLVVYIIGIGNSLFILKYLFMTYFI